ncbi:MAG: hypothetical protein ACR2MU_05715 [Gaiellaceae bacterium]
MDQEAIATVEHDLRGHLAIIVGYASLLELRADDALRLEASAHIQGAAALLQERLDELFAFLEA